MNSSLPNRIAGICLCFAETSRKPMGDHAAFLVRKKIFAYFLANHHGDGITSVCVKVLPGDNGLLVASNPVRFYLPACIGRRGWVGLRLDRGKIDWGEVKELIAGSYLLTAPKTLARGFRSELGEPAIGKKLRADNIRSIVGDQK